MGFSKPGRAEACSYRAVSNYANSPVKGTGTERVKTMSLRGRPITVLFLGEVFHGQADALTLFIHIQHHDLNDITDLHHLRGVTDFVGAHL